MFAISDARGGYQKTIILRGASIQVETAEVVALLGRNGAGKTTLMKYAMGLLERVAGHVELAGVRLSHEPSVRARAGLGYVPQGRYVFPRLSVVENIAAVAAAFGLSRADVVEDMLTEFPMLRQKAHTLAGSLSGGQQQVLAIARALATQPKLLILDEPTEGVQPSIVEEIAEILKRLNRERALAILVAEQDLDFCLGLAGRAYVMDRGTVVRQVSRSELFDDQQLLQELLGV
ncbi:ABC transporter ATP-binding protein [Paraburkholderia fungorum]|uniref:ABC transporter ATP-binding protein n=1 Tax=Paraburkholderia fungorum TaxID=134537 RepID=UPI0038BD873F